MTGLDSFIRALPKAELHLHIEGSLEPDLMLRLGERNRVDLPFSTVEEAAAAYRFTRLQDFLDIYYRGASVLHTAEDFYELAIAYFRRASADGVVHSEIFFDPQTHTARGLAMGAVLEGLFAAMEEADRALGMSSELILCFLRHLSEAKGFAALSAAEPWLDRIIGVGLDSSEVGHPPSKFQRLFAEAGRRGLARVAHAGEEGPASYVREALDLLGVDRIDHGNRSLEDPALVERLARDQIPLTVCPLSNLKLCVVEDLASHPLKRMLELGLRVTVNSDDPAYFGGYVAENYRQVAAALDLDAQAIARLARNSLLAAFFADDVRRRHLAALDKALGSTGV